MSTTITETDQDLRLLSELVDKVLRDRKSSATRPAQHGYRVMPEGPWGERGPFVRVVTWLRRDFTAELHRHWRGDEDRELSDLVEYAGEIADAITELHAGIDANRATLREVKAALRREIGKANRRGLRYRLVEAVPAPIVADGPVQFDVEVKLEMLGRTAQPVVHRFCAMYAEDVVQFFEQERKDQAERADVRNQLDELGATGFMDPVLFAALVAKGLDIPALLKTLGQTADWMVDVTTPGGEELRLQWRDGVVEANLDLGDGVTWAGGSLRFREAPAGLSKEAIGRPMNEFFRHEFLADTFVVRQFHGTPGGEATTYIRDAFLLFDSDAGQVW